MDAETRKKLDELSHNDENFNEFLSLLINSSADLSDELLSFLSTKDKWPDPSKAIALLGASIAMTKVSGHVPLPQFLATVQIMWHAQTAEAIRLH